MPRASQTNEVTTEKKRRAPQGPRKEKPVYLLFQVTDQYGEPVPNAKLNIVLATKDTDAVIARQAEGGVTLAKVEVAKSKGEEVETTTDEEAATDLAA